LFLDLATRIDYRQAGPGSVLISPGRKYITSPRGALMARPLPRVLAALAFLGFVTAGPVRAQQTWSGTTSNLWSDPTNWGGTVPVAGGTALFNGTGNGNVLIDLGGSARPIGTILFDTATAAGYTFSGNTGDAFTFDAAGAVTINNTVTTAQTFNTPLRFLGAFTATNNGTGTLTFNGGTGLATGGTAGLFTVTGTGNTVFNGVIAAGSVTGLTKSGTGTLTLGGANTYTGTTTVSAGTLLLTNALALQGSTVTGTGIVFDQSVSSNAFTFGNLTGAGAIALQNNATTPAPVILTVGANNASPAAYTGVLSGAGGVVKVGTGTTLFQGGTKSFTGDVLVSAGTLSVTTANSGNNSSLGLRAAGRTITVGPGATMQWNTNNILGGGGASAASLPALVVNGGTLFSTRYNMLPNITLNGGTLSQAATDGTVGGTGNYQGYQFIGAITVGGTSPSVITTTNGKGDHLLGTGTLTTTFNVGLTGTSDADLVVSAPLLNGSGDYGTGAASALTKTGPGTMRLSVGNPNTTSTVTVYSGPTTVSGGKFMVVPTAMSANATATVADGAAFGVFNTTNTANVSIATLNLGATTGGRLAFELSSVPTLAPLALTAAFTTAGTSPVDVAFAGTLAVGQFPLISYPAAGGIGGAGFAGLTMGNLPPRVLATLVNNTANSTVDLNVTGVDTIRWNGTVNGTWDINTTQNWKTNSTGANTTYLQPTVPGDVVTFDDQAAGNFTVTVATPVSPGSVTVNNTANNYTFTGAAIAGNGSLTKNGTGTLTVANDNTYAGGTVINAGVVNLGNGGTTGTLGSGPITNNASLVYNKTSSTTISAAISGTGSLTLNGSGNLTLATFNTYTGGTTVNAGSLTLTAGGTGTGAIVGVLTINPGGTVLIGTHDVFGYSSAAVALSTLNINGGTLDKLANTGVNETLTGVAVTMTGGLWAGTGGFYDLFTNGYGNTTITTVASPATATISASLNFRSVNNLFTVAAGTTPSGVDLLVSGALTGPNGLIKDGPGVMVINGANTYTGPTQITAGTLQVGDGTSATTMGNTAVTNNTTLILNPGANGFAIGGVSGPGTLTKVGPNAAALTGASSYTGDTTITAGTLRFAPTAAAVASTLGNINVAAAGRLGVRPFDTATTVLTAANVTLAAGAGFNFDLAGTPTVPLMAVTTALTTGGTNAINITSTVTMTVGQFPLIQYPGSIAGSGFAGLSLGSLPPRVLATLVNNTANSTVDLNVTGTDTIRWNGTANGTWDINTTQNWKTVSGGANTVYLQPTTPGDFVTFNDSATGTTTVTIPAAVAPAAVTVNNSTLNYTFTGPGAITGSIPLVKSGTGTLTLANDNTYTGGTQLNGGTLSLASANAIGTTGTITFGGGTLQFTAANTTDYSARFSAATGQAYNIDTNGQNVTLASALTSPGGTLTKTGTGNLTLTNLGNSFSGDLTVANGTLTAANALNPTTSANSSLGFQSSARTIRVNVGATLSFPSNNTFVGSGASASTLPQVFIAGTLTSTRYNAMPNITLSGGTLTQNSTDTGSYQGYQFLGSVTVIGTAPSTISTGNGKGNHLLPAGTLFDVSDVTGGTGPSLTVSTPLLNGSGDYPGTAGLTKESPGLMLLTGANTYTGPTTINNGAVWVTGNNAAATGAVTVAAAATFRGTNTYGGNISVSGAVGAGTPGVGTFTLANGLSVNAGGKVLVVLAGPAVPAAPVTGGSTVGTLPNPTSNNFLNVTGGVTTLDPGLHVNIDGTGMTLSPGQTYSFQIAGGAGDQSALNITNQSQFSAVGFTGVTTFALTGNATGAVFLDIAVVPEPAAVLAVCAAALAAGGRARRARRGAVAP
jgi:autotransporter-associated beta strand protein